MVETTQKKTEVGDFTMLAQQVASIPFTDHHRHDCYSFLSQMGVFPVNTASYTLKSTGKLSISTSQALHLATEVSFSITELLQLGSICKFSLHYKKDISVSFRYHNSEEARK